VNRRGHALLIALLGLLLLEVVVAGTMAIGTSERLLSAARVRQLRARLAAESGVRAALASWDAAHYGALPVGGSASAGSGALPGATFDATVVRRAADFFEVRANGTVPGPSGASASARAAAIVAGIPRPALWTQFAAAAALGGLAIPDSLVVDGLQAGALPPGFSAADCPPDALTELAASNASLAVPGVVLAPAASPGSRLQASGAPPILPDPALPDSADPGLAGIALGELRLIADRVMAGAVSIGPANTAAACDTMAASNWGVPDPAAACGGWLPLVYAPSHLHITGGRGQGVLVVDGDLTMDPGVEFHGAILVAGTVRAPDLRLFGAIRAPSAAPHELGGVIHFNACSLWRAFALSPGVGRPFRVGPRWWIPSF
jgi:hypothetical protein